MTTPTAPGAFDRLVTELRNLDRTPEPSPINALCKAIPQGEPLNRAQYRALAARFAEARAQIAASVGKAPAVQIAEAEVLLGHLGRRLFGAS